METPTATQVEVNGSPCRVWSKGSGRRVGFLAGFGGLPKWVPFLDLLAESYEVVVPSIPGFPGASGHHAFDSHLDWLLGLRDLLDGAGLTGGVALIGSGPGGALAADVAALWPRDIDQLVLIAPWGLYDEADPMADPWAQRPDNLGTLLCARPERWSELKAEPEGMNSIEWPIEQARALEASARIFWPLGNTGLAKRLDHIACPTLLLRGAEDRVIPASYLETFRDGIAGEATIETIAGAGHLAELDQPNAVAAAVRSFL